MSLFENFIFGLPNEIVIEICKLLSLKDLVGLTSVNTELMHIVRTTKWDHVRVTLRIAEITKYVVSTYQFVNYKLGSAITDDVLMLFKSCHTLNLCGCNIADESVKMLANCHTLRLSECNITDESVKMLGNCHTLDLTYCKQITDASVKMLGNCHTLYLYGCPHISKTLIKKTA